MGRDNTIRKSRRGGLCSLQKRVWEIYISHISRPLRDLRILFIPTHSLPHSRLHYGLYTNCLFEATDTATELCETQQVLTKCCAIHFHSWLLLRDAAAYMRNKLHAQQLSIGEKYDAFYT